MFESIIKSFFSTPNPSTPPTNPSFVGPGQSQCALRAVASTKWLLWGVKCACFFIPKMHVANPKRDGFPPESCNLLFQDFQFWTGKDFLLFVDEDGLFRKDSLNERSCEVGVRSWEIRGLLGCF